jgi:hypothetical protein
MLKCMCERSLCKKKREEKKLSYELHIKRERKISLLLGKEKRKKIAVMNINGILAFVKMKGLLKFKINK